MKTPITAIVLAAGESRRLGRPKQLEPFGGRTYLEHVLDRLLESQVDDILVVLGHQAAAIEAGTQNIHAPRVRIVPNPNYTLGMFTSVQAGLQTDPIPAPLLLALCDQPLIPTSVFDAVIIAFRHSPRGIIIPQFAGRRGHPVIFDACYRDEALAAPATGAMRDVLACHESDTWRLSISTDAIARDVDTEADVTSLTSPLPPAAKPAG